MLTYYGINLLSPWIDKAEPLCLERDIATVESAESVRFTPVWLALLFNN